MCARVCDGLGHDAEHRVVAADARADLLVVLLGVTHLVELRLKVDKHNVTKVFYWVSASFLKSYLKD